MMDSKRTPTILVAFHIVDKAIQNNANTYNNVDNFKDKILICKTFFTEKLVGSFFSCIYNGKLRIHVIFNDYNDSFNDEISQLIKQSMETAGVYHGMIWFRRIYKSIILYWR